MGSRYRPSRGVKQLGPGRWLVRARVQDPRTGRTLEKERRVKAATWQEAAKERDRLAAELANGATTPVERPRLETYAKAWVERRRGRVRPSTLERYVQVVAHLVAWLGRVFVDALRPGDVEGWLAHGVKQGYAHATVNGWLRVARLVAKDSARDLGGRSWCEGVSALPEGRTKGPRGTALTPAEAVQLLEALRAREGGIAPDIARALEVLFWTGMRRGEVLGLRWADIEGDEIVVSRSVWRGIEGSTKTDEDRPNVIVGPLAEVLAEQKRWLERGYRAKRGQPPGAHPGLWSGLVFPADPRHAAAGAKRRGGELRWYRSGTALADGLAKVVEAAALPRISLHSLRRTWARISRRAGVEANVRKRLAGWHCDEVQDRYEDIDRETRAAAGELFVGYVAGVKRGRRTD